MEKILDTFREMGFEMQNAEELGYSFRYEGINYLYMPNETDENFLNIAVPGIVDKEDFPEDVFSALLEKINSTLKYVKTYTLGNTLWIFYERELLGDEDLEPIITHMILHLEAATQFTRQLLGPDDDASADSATENEDETDDDTEILDAEGDTTL